MERTRIVVRTVLCPSPNLLLTSSSRQQLCDLTLPGAQPSSPKAIPAKAENMQARLQTGQQRLTQYLLCSGIVSALGCMEKRNHRCYLHRACSGAESSSALEWGSWQGRKDRLLVPRVTLQLPSSGVSQPGPAPQELFQSPRPTCSSSLGGPGGTIH